jgi:hypothetical protein
MVCVAMLVGCGPAEVGEGDLAVSVAANESVRVGFPHVEDGVTLEFVDGWSVTIERFAVGISDFELLEATPDGESGEVLASWGEGAALDSAAEESGEVAMVTLEGAPEGRHDVRFTVAPPADGALTNMAAADLEVMRERGWSMWIQGTATPDAGHAEFSEPIGFDLGFAIEATYYDCLNGVDGTKGVVVADGREGSSYIYPHLVHLFWDTLGAGDEQLRFDPMARAAGEDGVVQMEELDGVDLTSPELTDEAGVPLYNDAGLLDTYTLGAFVRRAMLESVHFNGIGFCKKRISR